MNQFWNKSGELKHAVIKEYLVRVAFVLISTINAIAFPDLGPLVSLVGAFSISLLNLIFPAIMEICLLYPPEYDYGRLKWKLIKDIILIIIGTFILVHGTYSSIREMIKDWGGTTSTAAPTTSEDTTETEALSPSAAPSQAPAFLRFLEDGFLS